MAARLKELYTTQIRAELMKENNYPNVLSVPTLSKIVINAGVGEATTNRAALDDMVEIITNITGQKPVINKAKEAISAFKVREGLEIGVTTTLRGDKMWEFLDKLINVVFPRTKDFRGLNPKAMDGAGNYSIGVTEHTVFPEIDPNKVAKIRPLQIVIVTTARTNEDSVKLLNKFGFPFVKNVN
jgi:large subunit ribosomal protein L5